MDIKKSVNKFLNNRNLNDRYSSFDFCYNYFYSFYKNNTLTELSNNSNIELSCHKLWFYLASWWMMRWSSFLLRKSVSHYKNVIIAISKMPKDYWEIDINNYSNENIEILLKIKSILIEALGKENKASDTLVTKIMLWIFWSIPAFDQYFKIWLNVWIVNKKNLIKISDFYNQNKKEFDSFNVYTLNFIDWSNSDIIYPKAKILDMYGFTVWFNK